MNEEQQAEIVEEGAGTAIPGEAAPVADQQTEGDVENGDGGAQQVSFADETRARDMGWRPKEEWNGPEDAWRPADEFLKRGEEILPIVKSRAERAENKVAKLESDLQTKTQQMEKEFSDRLRRMEAVNAKALERQRMQLYEQGEREKAEAVNNADPEAYETARVRQQRALAELNEQMVDDLPAPEPEKKAQPEQPTLSPEARQTTERWIERNQWFTKDPDMQVLAESVHTRLGREKPGMTLEENLSEVEKVIRKRFPEKFAPANHAPAVEGGGRQPGSSSLRAKGWNDLPAEAKAAGSRFIKEGIYEGDEKAARAAYAADFWEQG